MTTQIDATREVRWVSGFDNRHLLKIRPELDREVAKVAVQLLAKDPGSLSWDEFVETMVEDTGAAPDRIIMMTSSSVTFDQNGKCVLRPEELISD